LKWRKSWEIEEMEIEETFGHIFGGIDAMALAT